MSNQKRDKILSMLTSFGIALLSLVVLTIIAHTVITGSSFGDVLSASVVPLVVSALAIAGGIGYNLYVKKAGTREVVTFREDIEKFLNTKKLSSLNQNKKAQALNVIKSRDTIDFIGCLVCTASFVFAIDYILFMSGFTKENLVSDITGAFMISLIFSVIGIGAYVVREFMSDEYSEQALSLLKASAITGTEQGDSTIVTMREIDVQKISAAQKVGKIVSLTFIYIFLIAIALIVLFPFYWMIISSLKDLAEYKENIPTLFPRKILWSNYVVAFEKGNLGQIFMNTVYVGLVSTILSLVITVLSAFAFARLEFKGRDTLFAILLATMMIPGELFTITNYVTVFKFGWINTYEVLIIPFLVSVFYIYLLKQNFLQIPNELYLAAKVDGTKDFKYLWKVMIPLSLPTLISITILKMMGSWNSYMWPNLVTKSKALELVTNGIRNADFSLNGVGGEGLATDINYPVQMAAVALVSAPLFLVFLFLRKYIMKGVSRSGIKG